VSEKQDLGFKSREIHQAYGVVSLEGSRALARIEDQSIAPTLEDVRMVVAVEHDVVPVMYVTIDLQRVVHDHQAASCPVKLERGIDEMKAIAPSRR
jgi:hypothetical protein